MIELDDVFVLYPVEDRQVAALRGLSLSVAGAPAGWTVSLMGGGQPIAAAMAATDASVSLELRLDVPKEAPAGTTNLTISADGSSTKKVPTPHFKLTVVGAGVQPSGGFSQKC